MSIQILTERQISALPIADRYNLICSLLRSYGTDSVITPEVAKDQLMHISHLLQRVSK